MTLYDWLTEEEGDEDVATLDRAIHVDGKLPKMLAYDVSESWGDWAIDDEKVIEKAWNALMGIEVGEATDKPVEVLDGDIRFVFVWEDGTRVALRFLSDEWFVDDGNKQHPVTTPEDVSEVLQLCEENQKPMADVDPDYEPFPKADQSDDGKADGERSYGDDWEYEGQGLTDLAEQGGSYRWALDGDDKEDVIDLVFCDNGDEAPSVNEVTVQGTVGDKTYSGYIDNAYEVRRVQGGVDGRSAFIIVTYDEGDYYNIWGEARSIVRVEDRELSVMRLDD